MEARQQAADELAAALSDRRITRQQLLLRGAGLGLSASALSGILAACGGGGESESGGGGGGGEPFKVGFIYLGPPGDAGWTFQHDEARKFLESNVPNVKTTFIQNVPESDAGPALDELIAQGNKMIYATSFGYGDAVLQRAQQHPDVIFEHCSGLKRAENVATYYAVHWGAMYAIGIAAGRLTRNGQLGFVGSFAIPDVIIDANALALGAQSVNPSAKVKSVLINAWYDPPKEKQAASGLIDAGADVLAGVEDSPSILQEAARHPGVFSATWNSDMTKFGPDAFISAVTWDWGPYYVKQTKAAIAGTWKTHDYWGTLQDGTVKLAPIGPAVPDDVRTEVETKIAALKDESFNPFVGPLSDQSGKVRVSDGHQMTFVELLNWDWYVEGVQGSLG